jgi:hypothetical protein
MKVHINSDNQGILNAVKNVIPSVDDPIVNSENYNIQEGILSPFEYNFFMADIQFNEEVERDTALQSIKGLDGIINACLSESKVIGYIHNHDEGLPCEQETILEKE